MTQPDPEAPWGRNSRTGKPLLSPEQRQEARRQSGHKGGTERAKRYSTEEMAKQVQDGRTQAAKDLELPDSGPARTREIARIASHRRVERLRAEREAREEAESYVIKSRGWGKPLSDDDFQRTRKKEE